MAVTSVLGPDIDVAFELSTTQLDTGLSLPENLEAGVMSRGNEGVENDPRFRVTSCCDGLIFGRVPAVRGAGMAPARAARARAQVAIGRGGCFHPAQGEP